MVTIIEPKPNTFYVKKDLDDDVGVMPLYGDAYVGMTSTYDLHSNPNTTYYIGESTIISPDDYPYGEGQITECHLALYANQLRQDNSQTAAFVDVYSLKPNIDLTEGNLEIISGSTGTGHISVYSSIYDMGTPWFTEDFDGSNKFFMDVPSRNMPSYSRLQSHTLLISKDKYSKAVVSTHEATKGKHKSSWGTVAGAWETTKQNIDWAESKAVEGMYNIVSRWTQAASSGPGQIALTLGTAIGLRAFTSMTKPFALAGGWSVTNTVADVWAGMQEEIELDKHTDGLYYYVSPPELKHNTGLSKHISANILSEGHTRGWWMHRGAKESNAGIRVADVGVQYSSFDETFVAVCDQYNSMFSDFQYINSRRSGILIRHQEFHQRSKCLRLTNSLLKKAYLCYQNRSYQIY